MIQKNTTDVLGGGRARFGFFRILEQATGGSPPTQWYTPQNERIPFSVVRTWRCFRAVPFVEVLGVMVKSDRSAALQLRLRDCIVYPPTEAGSPQTTHGIPSLPAISAGRPSAAFPSQRCAAANTESDDGVAGPPSKRARNAEAAS